MKNPVLKSFLELDEMKKMYEEYQKFPIEENKIILEKKFKLYFFETRLLSYFSKSIHFASRRYDKKSRLLHSRNQLILDKPISDEGETMLDMLSESSPNVEMEEASIEFPELENFFEDELICDAVSKISLKQKEILYLAYVKQYSEGDIAEILDVSQQAVNKQKNKALNKIRGLING